ncbi:MAG: GldG family protein [bacterium]|nr:GldG family protein [bacterium]
MIGAGTGRGARFGITLQVVLTVGLAVVAVVLVNWLAGRPGVRLRVDLTEAGRNTLSDPALEVLGQLPEEVTVDIFYRPEPSPITGLEADVMTRTYQLLLLMSEEAREKLEVRNNDVSDRESFAERAQELNLRGFENCLIVHRDGALPQVIPLVGGLARFDIGNPSRDNFKPPRVTSFDAEEAIVQALLKVSQVGGRPKIYFTWGHGERDILGTGDPNDLGKLQTALVDDGFEATRWSFIEDGPFPKDMAALAIIGPADPISDEELDAIKEYVDQGGRLVLSPHPMAPQIERSRVRELLEHYGMEVSSGMVCQPFFVPETGQMRWTSNQVAKYLIAPQNMDGHPIVDPIRRGDRSFVVSGAHQIRRTRQPIQGQGQTAPLFRSFARAWIDGYDRGAKRYDWTPDENVETIGQRFELAQASQFVPAGAENVPEGEQRREARIVAMGTTDAFCDANFDYNADLLRNLFNWLTDREYRLSISTRNPDLRRIPPERVPSVAQLALWLLPGLCLLLGIVTAYARSRGGPRRQPA